MIRFKFAYFAQFWSFWLTFGTVDFNILKSDCALINTRKANEWFNLDFCAPAIDFERLYCLLGYGS